MARNPFDVMLTKGQLEKQNQDLGDSMELQWQLLSVAIDASNNCICITDPNQDDNPIIYANKGFRELTGYGRDEYFGRNCRFLQGNDHDQPGLRRLREAILEGKDVTVLLRNYRKDGSMFWNELFLSSVYDGDGNLIYFLGVQNDVTERVQHEQNLQIAIEQTFADPGWFTSAIMDNLVNLRAGKLGSDGKLDDLTERELQTLRLVARGMKNSDIAKELGLSVNTVRNYLASIYDKLDLHSRTDAAIWAKERGIS